MGIQLTETETYSNEESRIYGTKINLFYEEGDMLAVRQGNRDYKAVTVVAQVGGLLFNQDRKGVVTYASAQQTIPYITLTKAGEVVGPAEEVTGFLETAGLPSEERLREFTLELAQLACGEIPNPLED